MFDFVIPWCGLPGSSVHEISQARILEWVVGFCHLFPSFCIFTYCLCLLYLLPRVQVPHMSSSAIPFSFWKTEGKRRRGRHRMRWLDSITDWLWTRGPSSPWDLLKQGIELWFPALSGEFFTTESRPITYQSVQFSSVTQSCPTLRPHESQHARPPCPSPTPGVYPNSCPLSPWCHPAISSSVIPFFSCPQSLPASESFPMSQLHRGGQSIGVSTLASVLPMKT